MSISSLNNLSVQVAGPGSNTGMLMPKLKYRFRVTMLGFGAGSNSVELTKQVMEVNRPVVKFEPIPINVYNSTINLAGRHSWDNITLQVRDDASGQISRIVGQQMQKQFDFLEQASARSGTDYKFQTNIEMLDGGNGAFEADVLERWELYGCYIVSADYTDLGYDKNEASTISIEIQFDNAVQTPDNPGIGQFVGRQTATEMATGITPGTNIF